MHTISDKNFCKHKLQHTWEIQCGSRLADRLEPQHGACICHWRHTHIFKIYIRKLFSYRLLQDRKSFCNHDYNLLMSFTWTVSFQALPYTLILLTCNIATHVKLFHLCHVPKFMDFSIFLLFVCPVSVCVQPPACCPPLLQ